MLHPLIRAGIVAKLGLTPSQEAALQQLYGDCILSELIPPNTAQALLPFEIEVIHAAYSEVEKELRARRELQKKGNNSMSFYLSHRPRRNMVIKEVPPDFFESHGIQLTPFAEEKWVATVPPAISLRSGMSDAKDQGPAGHCTSFAVIGCLDYLHGKIDLSESSLTHEAERRHGDCNEGLALAHAFETATALGVVAQTDWQNDPRQTCWTNPPNTAGKPRYKFNANRLVFYRPAEAVLAVMEGQLRNGIHNSWEHPVEQYSLEKFTDPAFPQPQNFVRLLKATLANAKTPVAISLPVWWEGDGHFSAGWEDGPDIQMPTPVHLQNFLQNASPPNVSGWHAVAVCGYDDRTGRFEFKNSWHNWWGDQGFGTLPYDYVTAYAREGMHGWL
ncbi:hypothetical protein SRABI118_03157 [Massilia sp. Bi118]|nr:hypothetical protein SRABI118_03157 [Massilia sp. Bi118]